MPHGGGHAGGGGHGGGGHHHSGDHSSSSSGVHRSRSDDDVSELDCTRFVGAILLLCVAVILLIVPATALYAKNGLPISFVLSPGDTRIVSRSSTTCQGATLSGGTPLGTVNSSMYFLNNTPTLSANNSFVISSIAVLGSKGDYQYWSFHLYPGSKYQVAACLITNSESSTSFGSVQYYVIQGTDNYNTLTDNYNSWLVYLYGQVMEGAVVPCNDYNMTANLTFTSEDDYYFIFYNSNPTPASVQVTLSFYRPEYFPQSGGIISNCTTTSFSSCSLDIPYKSDYIILLETSPPSDGDWGANVDITSSCAARSWVYGAVESGMIAFLVISIPGVICILPPSIRYPLLELCLKKMRKCWKRMGKCSKRMGTFLSGMHVTRTTQVYTPTTVQTSTPAPQVPSNEV